LAGLETTRPSAPGRTSPPRREDGKIWLPAGSSLSYYLRQRPASEINLLARGTPGGTARLVARTQRETEAPREVGWVEPSSGSTSRLRFDLSLPEGAIFRLELASVGSVGVWIDQALLSDPSPPRPPRRSLPGRPNVVVFLVDALRADRLGAYGHPAPTSPRFDAFAREALLFEDAVAQSSWTRPAVASLFTGLGVDAHGVGGMTNTLVPELTTLAEAFRAAGYRTGAFVANHIVSETLGFAQGFDTWDRKGPLLAAGLVPRILSWVDGVEAPFFLYVHTVDLHGPYTPEPQHWAPFLFEGYQGNRNTLRLDLGPQELRFLRSAYDGEIRQGDAAFGVLMDGLEGRGLLDRSIVVFTADHGEEFREHGGGGHGSTLYREVLHIPLAVRLPGGVRGGLREPAPVQQIDVLPSLLALAGAPAVPGLEGRDLSANWLGLPAAAEDPPVLLSRLKYGGHDKVAVRVGKSKLILNRERNRTTGPRFELFDLAADPGEKDNLVAKRPITARYLWTQASTLRAAQAAFRKRHGSGREVTLSPEEIEQIRAMGYIQ
jgi:arylsulfatase A-like enzyme